MNRARRWFHKLIPLLSLFAVVGVIRVLEAGTTLTGQLTIPSPTTVMPGPILSGQALRLGETNIGLDPRATTTTQFQRPIGEILYARDGASGYLKVGSGLNAWEAISAGSLGGSATQQGAQIARAAQLTGISPSVITCWRDEYPYNSVTISINATAGTGSEGIATTDTVGGRLTVATGATAASTGLTTSAATVLGRPDTNSFYFAGRITGTTAIDNQTQFSVGFSNNALNAGITFGVCGSTSTTQWVIQYDGIPHCGGTVNNTGTSYVANTFIVGEAWGTANGKVHYAINGTEIAGSPFTMAASPVNSMRSYIFAGNGTTAANRSLDVDWFMACWSQT